jgi:xylulokinase
LGTSGTAFAVADRSSTDASGGVAGFADATGRFLPLVCTLNAARVVSAMANLLGVDLDRFNDLAVSTPDSGGLVLLPYLDGERTPDLPLSRGLLQGLSRANATPATLARATVEGMLCGLADGVDALRGQGVEVRRVLLIGGAAVSPAVQALAPAIFGVPVVVPQAGQYVARGAARQAAWVVRGGGEPPAWPIPALDLPSAPPATEVRKAYAAVRDSATPLLSQTF